MTQEEKMALLQGMFAGADLRGAQIIGVNEGDVYYQKYAAGATGATKTEEDVKRAVERLMEEKGDDGNYLMRDQDQWYALKMVLTTYCGFPQKPAEFSRTIENLGLGQLRVQYKAESVKKVHLQQLPYNVALWRQYKNTADQYSMKQVTVAVRLMEILEVDGM